MKINKTNSSKTFHYFWCPELYNNYPLSFYLISQLSHHSWGKHLRKKLCSLVPLCSWSAWRPATRRPRSPGNWTARSWPTATGCRWDSTWRWTVTSSRTSTSAPSSPTTAACTSASPRPKSAPPSTPPASMSTAFPSSDRWRRRPLLPARICS